MKGSFAILYQYMEMGKKKVSEIKNVVLKVKSGVVVSHQGGLSSGVQLAFQFQLLLLLFLL